MKIVILGGGPAGLYSGLLIKKANPSHDITIIERNAAGVTYGWGVVFSDRTLASFQRADYKSYEQITNQFVIWDAIDVHYRGETMRCGGHVISGIARKTLLNILQGRCREMGITLCFGQEINDLAQLDDYDLLIAADGINSVARKSYDKHFKPTIEYGKARYIWLGANKVLDAFTFIFCENEHGLFQVHAYPFNGTASTFLVECDEASWLNAGLDKADEVESLAYCQSLLAEHLGGAKLLSNNSKWISFPTLKTKNWQHHNMVLLGDAAHTAHFSIGSGTKLAMEDAIALAGALEQHADLESALNAYELERKPVVEVFQCAASESQAYFETLKRYLGLEPMQFTFQLLTRSGRITYDDLRFRDVRFGEAVDRWHAQKACVVAHTVKQGRVQHGQSTTRVLHPIFAPAPMFSSLMLRSLLIPNRLVLAPDAAMNQAQHGLPGDGHLEQFNSLARRAPGLILAGPVAITDSGRISPGCSGLYNQQHFAWWTHLVEQLHSYQDTNQQTKVAIELNHAGRRGSTRWRVEGLDRPLAEGNWPLIAASPIAYTPFSQVPREMEHADLERVRDDFARAARLARDVGFDLLQLNMAHGYLLASFLSPLTNQRSDVYGGDLEQRMRYPLEVFDAVRAAWPADKPVAAALNATDCVKGGFTIDDAVIVAKALKEHGCDIIAVQAGQTTHDGEPAYGRGFLTAYSDRIRNEADIPTMVGGYLTTSDAVNTVIAAGRADLCIIDSPDL
ncbi:MAG TPA: FAD-dependent monooxygenase [Ktedonobacteraceae bacterium]|nr:FAD-dependent monooxygenase [Ktedonobacteraceae bacterium]